MVAEVRGAAEEITATLSGVEAFREIAVDCARLEGGWCRVTVKPTAGSGDLREALAEAMSRRGLLVRELRQESAGLEAFFVRVTAPKMVGDGESQTGDVASGSAGRPHPGPLPGGEGAKPSAAGGES